MVIAGAGFLQEAVA